VDKTDGIKNCIIHAVVKIKVKTILTILTLAHLHMRVKCTLLHIATPQGIVCGMARKAPITIGVSQRALVGRIDRALRKEGQQLRTDRRGGGVKHIVIDTAKRTIVAADVDIVELARKLDVLEPWERLAS
jgi:hypothetical protein